MDFDLSSADCILRCRTPPATMISFPCPAHFPLKTRESPQRQGSMEMFVESWNVLLRIGFDCRRTNLPPELGDDAVPLVGMSEYGIIRVALFNAKGFPGKEPAR